MSIISLGLLCAGQCHVTCCIVMLLFSFTHCRRHSVASIFHCEDLFPLFLVLSWVLTVLATLFCTVLTVQATMLLAFSRVLTVLATLFRFLVLSWVLTVLATVFSTVLTVQATMLLAFSRVLTVLATLFRTVLTVQATMFFLVV